MNVQNGPAGACGCSDVAHIWALPPGYTGWIRDGYPSALLRTARYGVHLDGPAGDPAEQRPALADPVQQTDPEVLMMWIDDLMRKILKALACVTQESIGRSQDAQKASVKDECKNIDKKKVKEIEAQRKRRRSAVFGLLTKIATTLLIVVVVAAAVLSTGITGPVGLLAAVAGVMTIACALVDLVGACHGLAGHKRAFSLASLLQKAGVEKAELVACAMKLDLGGMAALGLEEAGVPTWAVILVSTTVMIIQTVLMAGGASKVKELLSKMGASGRQMVQALAKKLASSLPDVLKQSVDDVACHAAKQSADDLAKMTSAVDDAACATSKSVSQKAAHSLEDGAQDAIEHQNDFLEMLKTAFKVFQKTCLGISVSTGIVSGAYGIQAAHAQHEADDYSAQGSEIRADQEMLRKEVELAMQFVMALMKQIYACFAIVKDLLDDRSRCMERLTRSHGARVSMA